MITLVMVLLLVFLFLSSFLLSFVFSCRSLSSAMFFLLVFLLLLGRDLVEERPVLFRERSGMEPEDTNLIISPH